MTAEEAWTARRRRGTTTAPQESEDPLSVDADAGRSSRDFSVFKQIFADHRAPFNVPIRAIRRPTTITWSRRGWRVAIRQIGTSNIAACTVVRARTWWP